MQFHTQRRNMVIMVIFYGAVINTDMFFFILNIPRLTPRFEQITKTKLARLAQTQEREKNILVIEVVHQ